MPLHRKDLLELIARAQPSQAHSQRIEVRVTAVEEQLFKLAAKEAHTTVSEWLRAAGRAAAQVQLIKRRSPKRRGR